MKQMNQWIGNTPMFPIEGAHIYVKLEAWNPGGSIKDRTVYGMLKQAFADDQIHEDTKLIEATSGNTGIALAMLGACYHIPVTIVMSDAMSKERRRLIQAYGAKLVLSDGEKGIKGSLERMEELMHADTSYLTLGQFENPANPAIHEQTTGQEILRQVKDIDIFVCCVGSGGSFSGIAKALKQADPHIRCIVGEPLHSALLSGHEAGSHRIQGIGANFIPKTLDQSLIDDILWIDDEEAMQESLSFGRETGILVGISSGANIALAKRLAHYYPQKTIVTIAPDGGERYLSLRDPL